MRFSFALSVALTAGTLIPAAVSAQSTRPTELDPVVISAQRSRQSSFDAPAAISAVTRDTIDSAGPQVNLSEVLNRVPGISVLNRQNYAQDLQLSIRGFGARSTFGIRGVRVIVDGIPATMPDGQSQASNVSLGSVGRIEVLRGPLAQLYGNAAGGVVQVFTEDDAAVPTASSSVSAGPYQQARVAAKFSTRQPGYGLTLDASQYQTDGYRPHSAAKRGQLNARWQTDVDRDTRLSVVLNALEQPLSQDPLGLTRAQWLADPRQTAAVAITQDTRKQVRQQQLGTVLEHRFSEATLLTARLYAGQRALGNALSVPLAAQTPATSAGGIVQFDRDYAGLGVQLSHRVVLGAGTALRLAGGIELDQMKESRQGYINNAGVQGALKRDERNRVGNRDAYAQAAWELSPQWTATAGVRASEVRFRTDDHFITTGNPDDSGALNYSATNPVLGLSWLASPSLNVYANAGRGFETPTFTELAYRASGTGLNTALRASKSRHAELGAKWKPAPGQRVDVALFDIATTDEIVVDTNSGGRSTYKNRPHLAPWHRVVARRSTRRQPAQHGQPERAACEVRRCVRERQRHGGAAGRCRQAVARHAAAHAVRRAGLDAAPGLGRLQRRRRSGAHRQLASQRCQRRRRAGRHAAEPARRSGATAGRLAHHRIAARGQRGRQALRRLGHRQRGQQAIFRARAAAQLAADGDGALRNALTQFVEGHGPGRIEAFVTRLSRTPTSGAPACLETQAGSVCVDMLQLRSSRGTLRATRMSIHRLKSLLTFPALQSAAAAAVFYRRERENLPWIGGAALLLSLLLGLLRSELAPWGWLGLFIGVLGVRHRLARHWLRRIADAGEAGGAGGTGRAAPWLPPLLPYVLGLGATSVLWAWLPLRLFGDADVLARSVVLATVCVLAAGGAVSLGATRWLARAFVVAMLAPSTLLLLLSFQLQAALLAVLGAGFMFVLMGSIERAHRAGLKAARVDEEHRRQLQAQEAASRKALGRVTELSDSQEAFVGIHRALEQQFMERTLEMEDLTRELRRQARTDPLTHLLNRKGMNEHLDGLLLPLNGAAPTPLALFFIDLDGFKEINDALGHVTGDRALVLMAQRVLDILPDEGFAARWGGDEFVLVVPGLDKPLAAKQLAERLKASLTMPALIEGKPVRLSGCIGISLSPVHGTTAEKLIIAADLAVYRAKIEGHGTVRLYDESMAEQVEQRHRLAQALPASMDRAEISVSYQPIVSVDMQHVTHVEALARWTHPQWGVISPTVFIPMAEATGAIHNLGRWILRQACLHAARWPGAEPPKVSVNVSVLQLNTGNFATQVREALGASKLPASRLVIEITESMPIEVGGNAARTLATLREMGIELAIDDFGTGYSSLASLRQHPANLVKIDRSFVNDVAGEGAPIVQATVDIARSFGLRVVAEGVETTEQVDLLGRMGVRHLQGYLISKPLPDAQLHEWLRAHAMAQDSELNSLQG